jgi:hypothetical protein
VLCVPSAIRPIVSRFSVAFTRPTFQRFILLLIGFILAPRQRTVTGALRVLGAAAVGHFSSFHRVLSHRVWRPLPLGKILAAIVLEMVPRDQPVVIPVDDTATQHKGDHVWGKGLHRDACRSTKSFQVWLWGHRWLVLAVSIRLPCCLARPWALPVLCAFYRPKELDEQEKRRRHKTPIDLARQLVALLIRWFPERKFVLVADGAFACHELANWCWRRRQHVTLVSRFRGDANLYAPPPKATKRKNRGGRPRVKGRKLASPARVVERSKGKRFTVGWYGGGTRKVSLIWGEGGWYRGNIGLTPVRWVHVHDRSGTHRDEYFFSTDAAMQPQEIVRLYTERWGIEVTFQEAKQKLGLGTPRNRCKQSVLRTVPCLMGCFTIVSLMFAQADKGKKVRSWPWYCRKEPTFGDALTSARRLCWAEVFETSRKHRGSSKLPEPLREILLDQLSLAA